MLISAPPYFRLGSGIWASTPEPTHHELLHQYTTRTHELLAHNQECIPDDDRLHVIVKAAMEARALYFVSALQEPSTGDLDRYFDLFVICSVFGIPNFNEVPNES
jgi:hypothetical protein